MKVSHYIRKFQNSNTYQNFIRPSIVGIGGSPELMESYETANPDKAKTMRIANNVFRIASCAPLWITSDSSLIEAVPNVNEIFNCSSAYTKAQVNKFPEKPPYSREVKAEIRKDAFNNFKIEPTVIGRIVQAGQYLKYKFLDRE